MSDPLELQQNLEQNLEIHVEEQQQMEPVQNVQAQQHQNAGYVRQMRNIHIEDMEVQPPADLAWAYEEEKQRLEIRAQQEAWSQRKTDKEFKALKDKLKSEMKTRKKEAKKKKKLSADLNLIQRESVAVHPKRIPVDSRGHIVPFSLNQKKQRRTQSDDIRVDKKKQLLELTENDKRNVFLNPAMKALIKEINQYAKINATANTLVHKEDTYRALPFLFDIRAKKAYFKKSQQLDDERDLAVSIRNKINEMLQTAEGINREILLDYKSKLVDRLDGKLDTSDPNIKVKDYTNKHYKLTFSKLKKGDDNNKESKEFKKKDLETLNRAGEPLFPHEPCAKDVAQQSFGDCYFLATLSSIVAKHPDKIREMMKDNGDSVTVRFYRTTQDESTKNWTVEPQFIKVSKETAYYSGGADTLWVQIMEKAYAVFLRENEDQRYKNNANREYMEQKKQQNADDEIDFVFMANGGNQSIAEKHLLGTTDQKDVYISSEKTSNLQEIMSEPADAIRLVFSGRNDAQVNAWLREHSELIERRKSMLETLRSQNIEPKDDQMYQDLDQDILKLEKKISELELNQDVGVFTSRKRMSQKANTGMDIFIKEIVDEVLAARSEYKTRYLPLYEQAKKESEEANSVYEQKRIELDQLKKDAGEVPSNEMAEKISQAEQELKKLNDENTKKRINFTDYKNVKDNFEMEDMGESQAYDMKLLVVSAISKSGESLITQMIEAFDLDMTDLSEAKENYEQVLEGVKNFDATKESPIKDYVMNYASVLTIRCGITEEKALEFAKRTALAALERLIDKFDSTFNLESEKIFTGVYNDEAIELYNDIQNALTEERNVTAATKSFVGKKSSGHAGEHMEGGVAAKHAYDVLGVDEFEYGEKKLKFVKIRNPWGSFNTVYRFNTKTNKIEASDDMSKTNGIGLVELNHFMQKFSDITIGSKLGGDAS